MNRLHYLSPEVANTLVVMYIFVYWCGNRISCLVDYRLCVEQKFIVVQSLQHRIEICKSIT